MRWNLSLVAVAVLVVAPVSADTITLDATGKGSYSFRRSGGVDTYSPSSGFAAIVDASGTSAREENRTWTSFDLSDISGSVQAATLTFRTGTLINVLNESPGDPRRPIQYRLFDVEAAAGAVATGTGDHAAIFADLGNGALLGGRDFTETEDENLIVEIALTHAGLTALQSGLGGHVSLGGAVVLIPSRWPVLLLDSGYTPQLTMVVPEPPTVVTLLVALSVLCAALATAKGQLRRDLLSSASRPWLP